MVGEASTSKSSTGPFAAPYLKRIVEGSLTLDERLRSCPRAAANEPAPVINLSLLYETWQEVVGDGDRTLLDKRLEWDAITESDLAQALRYQPAVDDIPWAGWLKDWLFLGEDWPADAQHRAEQLFEHALDPRDPIPFEEALLIFCVRPWLKIKALAEKRLGLPARIELEQIRCAEGWLPFRWWRS